MECTPKQQANVVMTFQIYLVEEVDIMKIKRKLENGLNCMKIIGSTQKIQNYFSEAQILFTGDYLIGQKTGIWMTIFEDKIIGGGCYANNGMKHGKWIDLYHNFWEYNLISLDFVKQLFKVHILMELKQPFGIHILKIIQLEEGITMKMDKNKGSGLNFMKILISNYIIQSILLSNTQIKINGNYQNGRKSGSWEFINKSKIIGGGLYDENGFKHGKWTELDDDFNLSLVDPCKITYSGEYKRGQKQGKFVAVEIY
ncbi:unnamed protein product [Paramecium primaurelia]|uniref:Uncharacterized protein n=1 Tax=Paramecium primaurelia TaxID=5886 RepID=A0A8S1QDG0_PARPR|nr:unnamed protein product [Paramecium primaurelia]